MIELYIGGIIFLVLVGILVCVCVYVTRRERKLIAMRNRHLKDIYSVLECAVKKYPGYGPKDMIYFYSREAAKNSTFTYEQALDFLEEDRKRIEKEIQNRNLDRYESETACILNRRASNEKTAWALCNDFEKYKTADAEYTQAADYGRKAIELYGSERAVAAFNKFEAVKNSIFTDGEFMSEDGDQSRNRLKTAENEFVDAMHEDLGF